MPLGRLRLSRAGGSQCAPPHEREASAFKRLPLALHGPAFHVPRMPPAPGSGPATMDDVARASGVAVSTVSRALRNDQRIGESTRLRIKQTADQLGYRPNPMVAALMSQLRAARPPAATCNLAWLDFTPYPDGWSRAYVQRAFYAGAEERAGRARYTLERVQVRAPGMTPARLEHVLQSRGVRGVLLASFEGSKGLSTSIPLPLDAFSFVTVGIRLREPALHFATNDQFASSRLAVQELWRLGYRRIGFVGVPFAETTVNNRFVAGYLATVQLELGGTPLPPLLSTDPADLANWLRQEKPEVVITTHPPLTEHARAAGWRVPEQLGVAQLHVDRHDATASGICQNSELVGAAAIDLLIGQLSSNEHGVPAHATGMIVPGFWMPGKTVRRIGV